MAASYASRIRLGVMGFSLLLAVSLYADALITGVGITSLVSAYSLIAASFLYTALIISPLTQAFPAIPFKGEMVMARRSLGVSAAVFASVHGYIAFFEQLGGFAGLPYLPQRYLTNITFSAIALFILLLLTATSFDAAVRVLGPWWKRLHRLVYAAGVLILVHALALGSHFSDTSETPFRLGFVLLFLLLGLEAARLDRSIARKVQVRAHAGIFLCIVISLGGFLLAKLDGTAGTSSFSVHNQHVSQAKTAQQNGASTLGGDRTKRYSVSFSKGEVVPGQEAEVSFRVTDAATGQAITQFTRFYEQFVHVVIVDDSLEYFYHTHPTYANGAFTFSFVPPASNRYRAYLNFHPFGGTEQAFAEIIDVGSERGAPAQNPGSIASVAGYEVSLTQGSVLRAAQASIGGEEMRFKISRGGSPVASLKPYLGAYGHLSLVNTDTYEFIHVHPLEAPANADSLGGPEVVFVPLGLYGPIRPGTYRAFAEFNPDGNLIAAPVTVTIK